MSKLTNNYTLWAQTFVSMENSDNVRFSHFVVRQVGPSGSVSRVKQIKKRRIIMIDGVRVEIELGYVRFFVICLQNGKFGKNSSH